MPITSNAGHIRHISRDTLFPDHPTFNRLSCGTQSTKGKYGRPHGGSSLVSRPSSYIAPFITASLGGTSTCCCDTAAVTAADDADVDELADRVVLPTAVACGRKWKFVQFAL